MARNFNSLIYDYVVFAFLMLASLLVPLFTKLSGPKQSTKADYVFAAASKISMGAMLMSLARGVLGVRSFLGYPSELFYNGTRMYEIIYGLLLAYPIASYFFIPVYYNLGITSVYQYLDLRFKSQAVRSLASGFYILRNILNTGVTVFTPCVALKTIIGFPHWVSIVSIMVISMICAFMGGLKAVILTDVIQGLISLGCMLTVIIKGTIDVGGLSTVFKTNYDNGRFRFFNFDINPEVRVSTVSAFLGQLFMSASIFGCQQNFVQRYCSMQSLETVQRTLWVNVPVIFLLFSTFWFAGVVIYANYATCDPLTLGLITKIDEIVPFYVDNTFSHIPGLVGIFMAALFNGALSLTISNLNSMATVAWEDFVRKIPCFRNFKDNQELLTIKFLVAVFGVLIIGVAFGIALLPGLVEASQLVTSATSGPLLGVFILAMFCPACNWKGAATGMIASLTFTLTLMMGRILTRKKTTDYLPLSIEECSNVTFSTVDFNSTHVGSALGRTYTNNTQYSHLGTFLHNESTPDVVTALAEKGIFEQLFSITYMYYAVMGTASCVILALIVSYITGVDESDVFDSKLIHPIALRISNLFPGKPRKYLTDDGDDLKDMKFKCGKFKSQNLFANGNDVHLVKIRQLDTNLTTGTTLEPSDEGKTKTTTTTNTTTIAAAAAVVAAMANDR